MIKIIFLCIVVSNTLCFSQDWKIVSDLSDDDTILHYTAVDGCDSLTFVVAGYTESMSSPADKYTAFINVSTNGGKKWFTKYKINNLSLKGMKYPPIISRIKVFPNNTIIAPVRNGLILRSTDLGETWDSTFVECHEDGTALNLSFYNDNFGCIQFYYTNIIWFTDDAGKTWESIERQDLGIGPYGFLPFVRIKDSLFVGLSMNFSTRESWILRSDDKGNTWKVLQGFNEDIQTLYLANDSVLYAGGQNYFGAGMERRPVIYKSTDRGYSWKKVLEYNDRIAHAYYLSVLDENNVMAVSFADIFRTEDGGKSWSFESFEEGKEGLFSLRKGALVSSGSGIIICKKEYLLSNSIDVATRNKEYVNINSNKVFLHPNPATSQITLSLGDNFISEPEIDIIDYLGNAIKMDYEINGSEITINTSSLSPGVYFLRIRSGGQVETRKFVVVR